MKEIVLQNLALIIIGAVIAILGIVMQKSRAYFLIAGYNTMEAEKRRKVNIEQVAIAIRNSLIILGSLYIIVPIIGDIFGLYKLKFLILIGFHLVVIIILLREINTRDKYKK
ncbi:MAG: DUF3784 domain-containing protein [Bacteroidales bacterium]|nr:DUF3784 domain-containing protein [Bacteroidales bacterium]